MGRATNDVLHAHSCRSDSRAGVCRSRGGESCAFDGAMIVLQCIGDAAHLVHGPIACVGNSWETRGTVSDKGLFHRVAFTTDLGELDIIHGAEERLAGAIRQILHRHRPAAVFVYATCVTGLIGEDIEAVCKAVGEEAGARVIPVHGPGFVGPKNLGNRIAGEVLLDHVIGTGTAYRTTETDICLIGEYNIARDLANIEPLFAKAGIRVLSRITGNSTFAEITWAHQAKASALVCGRALINVARELELRYGVPYIEASFFGMTQTAQALRSIAGLLERYDTAVRARVDDLIAHEERNLKLALTPYRSLRGKKAVLYSGGVKSWSLISALRDLGIEVVAVGAKKSTSEDEEKIRSLLGPGAVVAEDTKPGNLLRLLRDHGADVLIAGGRNRFLAAKEGIPFVDVNQERHVAFAGYAGLVNLAAAIAHAMNLESGVLKSSGTACTVAVSLQEKSATSSPVRPERRSDLSENPLKHSPALGAALVFQGLHRGTAVLHGAQGCTFLAKALLTRHFKEPVSLVSTKLFTEDVVMGSNARLRETLSLLLGPNKPDVAGILSSGLTEVKGEDLAPALGNIDHGSIGENRMVVPVSTPDYAGGLEEGYAAAVLELVRRVRPGLRATRTVNVLAGPALTPGDVRELKMMIADFGVDVIVLPDLSCLDGSRIGFSPLAEGGTSVADIKRMGTACLTIAVGTSMEPAARELRESCGIPYFLAPGFMGLRNVDALAETLRSIMGIALPDRYRRDRAILVDGMRDVVDVLGGSRVALALETDAAVAISTALEEAQADIRLAVLPTVSSGTNRVRACDVVVGDFSRLRGQRVDLLIANAHGRLAAVEEGMGHLEWGFPVFRHHGVTTTAWTGYRGTLRFLHAVANHLSEVHT